jgi:DNA-binding IclR family transcriptional regulator
VAELTRSASVRLLVGIVDIVQPSLESLAETCGELVRLAVADGDELIFVAKAQGFQKRPAIRPGHGSFRAAVVQRRGSRMALDNARERSARKSCETGLR